MTFAEARPATGHGPPDPFRRTLRGRAPQVDPTAYVAPTAVLAGQVRVGPGAVVLDGAVVTAESAPVSLGEESIVMENAVVRGAGRHPTDVGARTLIGPGAHVSGARIGAECMVATRASIFNGARVADGVLVAIGAIVHVGTVLPAGTTVPMQHIAVGDPCQILPPERAPEAHELVDRIGFTAMVFDHDTSGLDLRACMSWLCGTYSRALRRTHAES
ncbi:gamma carbonic anhydrase family protein [Micromonospora sp. CPCC 206060]|uniref:gamma carbonic anhydrase family protein n=1 Tax=Micromonospora sp. CPCC 206060 TaxID=3122406 RepID=UPI002FF26FFD